MDKYQRQLTQYQFQMGAVRGRLAMALDVLTDALALVGQHGVYCQSGRRGARTALDVRLIMSQLEDSKDLIQQSMKELKDQSRPGPA